MKQLKHSDIKQIRELLAENQGNVCPICEREFTEKIAKNLDHCHESGKIRGVLCRACNSSIEGAFRSKWVRSGLSKDVDFRQILFNLYLYLDPDSHYGMLHPTHSQKPKKLQKRSYQELKKEVERFNEFVSKETKVPEYPKSGRLTKKLKELYEKFGIIPKFYSK